MKAIITKKGLVDVHFFNQVSLDIFMLNKKTKIKNKFDTFYRKIKNEI